MMFQAAANLSSFCARWAPCSAALSTCAMAERTRWGAAFVLIFAGVISALQIGKAATAVPVLQHELALTLVAASWIVGAYGVLGAVAGLPAAS